MRTLDCASIVFWVLLCLLLLSAVPVAAEEGGEAQAPLRVTSDRLEVHDAAGTALFTGEVVARRGDATLYARSMTVRYEPKTRLLASIEADGEVRLVQGDRVAVADRAVYDHGAGVIRLIGSARVNQRGDFVEGERILLFLDEDRSLVEPSEGGRVNAVFQSGAGEEP